MPTNARRRLQAQQDIEPASEPDEDDEADATLDEDVMDDAEAEDEADEPDDEDDHMGKANKHMHAFLWFQVSENLLSVSTLLILCILRNSGLIPPPLSARCQTAPGGLETLQNAPDAYALPWTFFNYKVNIRSRILFSISSSFRTQT